MTVPADFVLHHRPSRYLEWIGPLYEAVADASVVRLQIDERHTNARGFLHAGRLVLAASGVFTTAPKRETP